MMPDCKACGMWFAAVGQHDLCPTCKRALERLNSYAAPVVRCRDCKKIKTYGCRMVASGYDDFCSYGERKDGADAEG